jgi:antitoxin (DNA-binding transcriptional repressor) of toxin-antitoxin stability system
MTIMKYPQKKGTHYNVAEAKAQFSTLIRKALQGEEVVIARDNQPLLKLVPVGVHGRTPGSGKGRVTIAADFDAPLDDFIGYR